MRLGASVSAGTDLSEAISQLLPPCGVEALQRSQELKPSLSTWMVYTYSSPTAFPVVGRATVTSLGIQARYTSFHDGVWEMSFLGSNESAMILKQQKEMCILPTLSFWFSPDYSKGGRFTISCST